MAELAQRHAETLRAFDTLPDSSHVHLPVVSAIQDCSDATTWRRTANGILPRPKKIGASTVWNVGELRAALGLQREKAAA